MSWTTSFIFIFNWRVSTRLDVVVSITRDFRCSGSDGSRSSLFVSADEFRTSLFSLGCSCFSPCLLVHANRTVPLFLVESFRNFLLILTLCALFLIAFSGAVSQLGADVLIAKLMGFVLNICSGWSFTSRLPINQPWQISFSDITYLMAVVLSEQHICW